MASYNYSDYSYSDDDGPSKMDIINASSDYLDIPIDDFLPDRTTITTPAVDKLILEEIAKREMDFFLSYKNICQESDISSIKASKLKFQADSPTLTKYLISEPYNVNVENVMSCTINPHNNIFIDSLENTIVIKEWFNKVKFLNKGIFGSIYYPDKDDKSPFLIKYAIIGNNLHEAFIGFQLNKLRSSIVNFMYTYSYMKLPSIIGYSDQFIALKNDKDYLFVENIPSITLADFINLPECTVNITKIILLQIFFSLQLAYKEFDFTHYDLHGKNILVRRLLEEVQLMYSYHGKMFYMKTNLVVFIIDYGKAHIQIDGYHYGQQVKGSGEHYDSSYPLYDMRRLLLNTLAAVKKKDLVDYITDLLLHFTRTTITKKMIVDYFNVNKNLTFFPGGYERVQYSFLIDIILKEKLDFISDVPYFLENWNCLEKECKKSVDIVDEILVKDGYNYETHEDIGKDEIIQNITKNYLNIILLYNTILKIGDIEKLDDRREIRNKCFVHLNLLHKILWYMMRLYVYNNQVETFKVDIEGISTILTEKAKKYDIENLDSYLKGVEELMSFYYEMKK